MTPPPLDKKDYRFHRVADCAILLAGGAHFFYIFLFLFLKIPLLPLVNVFSTLIWIACFFLNRTGLRKTGIFLGFGEILLHAAITVVLVGWPAGFHVYIICLAPFIFFIPFPKRTPQLLLLLFIAVVYGGLFLYGIWNPPRYAVPDLVLWTLGCYNVAVLFLSLGLMALYYEKAVAEAELAHAIAHARSETLLLNILPASIAKRLKEHPDATIADDYPSATVLFADLVGFTEMCTLLSPNETVDLLNRIYSHFDTLAEKYGLEKIKTIGDAYMVVGGVPVETDRHARSVGLFALRLQEIAKSFSFEQGAISLRIGIHTGRLVAGVIGKKKFSYDVWGDTVNIANRMESHGVPGKIHCSEAFHAQARADFDFTERGEVDIKGKGKMRTYFLEKQKPSAPPPGSSAKAG